MGNLMAVGHIHGDVNWTPGAIQTNPVDGTILVDTGTMNLGKYLFAVVLSSTVASSSEIQYRNVGNSASIAAQRRGCLAGFNDDFMFPNKLIINTGERLRVVQVGGVTGTVQASIFWMELA
jgi:hypothetical protein